MFKTDLQILLFTDSEDVVVILYILYGVSKEKEPAL